MYCDPPIDNNNVSFGQVVYSDRFDPDYMDFPHINTTYWVECDTGYMYLLEQNVTCENQSTGNDPDWAEAITECRMYFSTTKLFEGINLLMILYYTIYIMLHIFYV